MLLKLLDFGALLNKIYSFSAALLSVLSSVHQGRGCFASYDKSLSLVIIGSYVGVYSLHRIYNLKIYGAKSCVQILVVIKKICS